MRLTKIQRRALRAVARVQARDDVAHNLEGDLTLTSGNWPATAKSLRRKGLIEIHYDPQAMEDEEFTYTLTAAGRRALEAAPAFGNSQPPKGGVEHGYRQRHDPRRDRPESAAP